MNIFSKFGHVFVSLFAHSSDAAEVVVHDVSGFALKAEPIVAEIEDGLKKEIDAGDHSKVLTAIQNFLLKFEPDLQKVGQVANELGAMPKANLLQGAAQFALTAILPGGVPTSLIRLAIEFAYNILLAKKANPALATPSAPVPVPATP